MATQPWNDDPPDVSERYESASGTSNLTVSASFGMVGMDEATPQGDTVLAAGLVASNRAIGMALLRLHSEFAAAAKPRHVGKDVVTKLTAAIREADKRDEATAARNQTRMEPRKPAWQRAQDEVDRWYSNELALLATRLKTRRDVIDKLTVWGAVKGIPGETVSLAVTYWLDATCGRCHGHGLRFLEHSAARQCGHCYGSGKEPRPDGIGRVLEAIDDMLNDARGSLRRRLHDIRQKK
jgi:hypothetical protein